MKPASSACNMRCKYCFYEDESKNRENQCYGMMSYETLKSAIRRAFVNGEDVISIVFQGGEPTLRGLEFFEKVIALEEKYNRKGLTVWNSLQTNGLLIDEKWCAFLAKNHFLVGLSVDGTQLIHDGLRKDRNGEFTYQRVCNAAKLFDEYHVDYNILTVVTKDVAKNIKEIYRNYKKMGWRYLQFISCLEPLQEERGTVEYAILPEEYGVFLTELFDLWYIDYKQNDYTYIRQFENHLGMILGMPPEACEQRGICGIQHVVEADGSVYPCDFYVMDEYRLGNLNTDKWDDIQKKREEIGFVKRSCCLDENCKNCEYFGFCRGGCQRNRVWNEKTKSYTNYFCESYKTFFAYASSRLEEMAKGIEMIQHQK